MQDVGIVVSGYSDALAMMMLGHLRFLFSFFICVFLRLYHCMSCSAFCTMWLFSLMMQKYWLMSHRSRATSALSCKRS